MSEMPSAQEAHDQACAAIGKFINVWSHLEADIAWGIHRIYKMEFASGAIITGNLGLAPKIAVLRSALSYRSQGKMTDEWRREADKVLEAISNLVSDRNIAAHSYFEATEEGDVRFVRLHVKKGFEEKELVWSKKSITDRCVMLLDLSDDINQLVSELAHDGNGYLSARWPSGRLSQQTPRYLEDHKSSPPQAD